MSDSRPPFFFKWKQKQNVYIVYSLFVKLKVLVLLTYGYLFCQFALFYEFTKYENDFFNHHPCIFNLLYEDSSETFKIQQVYIILRYIVVVFDTHKYFCNHFKLEKKNW